MKTYEADDSDLPRLMLSEGPAVPNRVQAARLKILQMAAELNIVLSFDEISLFAIIYIALQDTGAGDGTKP